MRVLILGGTTEGAEIARALAGDGRFAPVLSLAGRTRVPALAGVPGGGPGMVTGRRGGFGGVDGLVRYLREEGVGALVDATHPFAARMHAHAAEAAGVAGVARVAVWRPGWVAQAGDRWVRVGDMAGAAEALGRVRRRVLLTVGRQELGAFVAAPWHDYLVRSVEAPEALPEGARWLAARGPFEEAGERALMVREGIELVVTKDSGGEAVAAKLAAARGLGIPVVVVERPGAPAPPLVGDTAGVLGWLDQLAERGV